MASGSGRTIAFVQQKGGVTKTTTTVNVAHELARLGYRVLVCDLDPQNAATTLLCGTDTPALPTLSHVLTPDSPVTIRQAIRAAADPWQPRPDLPWHHGGAAHDGGAVDILPADSALGRTAESLGNTAISVIRKMLHRENDGVAAVSDDYDVVLIDCQPSEHLPAHIAVMAAKFAVLPFTADAMAYKARTSLLETISDISESFDEQKIIVGVVINKYSGQEKNQRTHRDLIVNWAEDELPHSADPALPFLGRVWGVEPIPRRAAVERAADDRVPVAHPLTRLSHAKGVEMLGIRRGQAKVVPMFTRIAVNAALITGNKDAQDRLDRIIADPAVPDDMKAPLRGSFMGPETVQPTETSHS